MQYLMAIDAGTGSIRVVIFDTLGNQIAVAQKEWFHIEEEDTPYSMTFDTEKNWKLVVECIKLAILKANIDKEDLVGVSASSMREGIIVYDKNGDELWGVANVDARAFKEVKELKEHFIGIEEKFYHISGQTFALGALPRLLWLKNHKPTLYDKVASLSMISDWILFKLSGILASDPSNAGTSGIFSLKNRDWVSFMAKEVGLKEDIFPPCLETGSVIGNITPEACITTNLSSSTKVVMGGGDVQLASLGLGVIKEGDVAIIGGSFWQQVVNIPINTSLPKDSSLRVNPHVISSLSQAEGITFFSGLIMRWFRDAFCEIEKNEAKKRGIDTYEVLEEKAKDVPVGSYGILPIFSDTMKYQKWYHASPSFLNLSLDPEKSNRASMFRSLEENASIVSAINLEKIKAFSNITIEEVVFAGGASKGELWCQILADVLGCRVKVPRVKEATALGTMIATGVGVGIYSSMEEGSKKVIRWEKVYYPNQDNYQRYQKIKKQWEAAYVLQLTLVDKNLTQSMWKAPGI